jgi:hypothetical protein
LNQEVLAKVLSSIRDNKSPNLRATYFERYVYHEAEKAYEDALEAVAFWDNEARLVNDFSLMRQRLLTCVERQGLSREKTKIAVCELMIYIDQQVERNSGRRLTRKTSWATLHGALDKTCVLLERPYALDDDALDVYTRYSNGVDGKPLNPTPGGYEFLFPALPLILGVKFLLTGLNIGFLAGGILCPALGMAMCLLASAVALYFLVQMFTHTGLSRKMLDIAHAEREFAENPQRASLIDEYKQKRAELINEDTTGLIESIEHVYGTKNRVISFSLLNFVEKMLKAKTEEELNKIKDEFIGSVQRTTSGSFFATSFKDEENQLKNEIKSLANCLMTPMKEQLETQYQQRSRETEALMSQYNMTA